MSQYPTLDSYRFTHKKHNGFVTNISASKRAMCFVWDFYYDNNKMTVFTKEKSNQYDNSIWGPIEHNIL